MTDRQDLGPRLSAEEREQLTLLAERLRRDRPLPSPVFRGDLRRRLHRPATASAILFRLRVTSCVVGGFLCLLVAAAGLVGAGPFAV